MTAVGCTTMSGTTFIDQVIGSDRASNQAIHKLMVATQAQIIIQCNSGGIIGNQSDLFSVLLNQKQPVLKYHSNKVYRYRQTFLLRYSQLPTLNKDYHYLPALHQKNLSNLQI